MEDIPKWQEEEVQRRREAYLNNPSLGQDFDEAMDEIENGLPDAGEDFILTDEMKAILDERAKESTENYISGEESLEQLKRYV